MTQKGCSGVTTCWPVHATSAHGVVRESRLPACLVSASRDSLGSAEPGRLGARVSREEQLDIVLVDVWTARCSPVV